MTRLGKDWGTRCRRRIGAVMLLLGVLAWSLTACGGVGRVTTTAALAPSATNPSRSTTTAQRPDVDGPIDPALGIPMPYLDEGYYYHGNGRFVTVSGREFFWRNGRFENRDGSLLEVPESVNDKLKAAGMPPIDAQPTRPPTTFP